MFDFAWSEFGVIAVAALIFIGPKDMPVAIKAVTGAIKKARRMAAEFQTHVDDLVREADLHEIRDQIGDLRSLNLSRTIEKFVDEDGSIRRSFDDPLASTSLSSPLATAAEPVIESELAVAERPEPTAISAAPDDKPAAVTDSAPIIAQEAPAFIPPGFVSPPRPTANDADAPSFVPPQFARGSPLAPPPI
jgi:sec-independent protein translocase protein TatB